MRNKIS